MIHIVKDFIIHDIIKKNNIYIYLILTYKKY